MVVATQAQLDYTAVDLGLIAAATLAAQMDPTIIPPPMQSLEDIGCTFVSDVASVVGSDARRRLTVSFDQTPATATVTRNRSSSSGPIDSLVLTGNGAGYAGRPIITIGDSSGFAGAPIKVAQAHANMELSATVVGSGGSGYTGATKVTFVGGLLPGGTPATGTVNLLVGAVSSITITARGGPYFRPPQCVITDTGGGVGALVYASLRVNAFVLDFPGFGYISPTFAITGLFKHTWPDGGPDQRQPFFNVMSAALHQGVSSPIKTAAPVLLP